MLVSSSTALHASAALAVDRTAGDFLLLATHIRFVLV
jgi:hypothetical protein